MRSRKLLSNRELNRNPFKTIVASFRRKRKSREDQTPLLSPGGRIKENNLFFIPTTYSVPPRSLGLVQEETAADRIYSGLQRRAWNFPPVGRPAQPHPIGGARWRRCEDAEIDSGSDHRLKWEPTPGPPCRKEAEDAGDNHSLKPRTPCWGPPVTPTTPSSPNLPHPLSICWLLKTQREGCLAQQELSPKAAIPVSMATGVPTQTSKVGGQKTEEGWRICTSVLWLLKPTKNFSFVPPRKRPKTPGASFLISEHDMCGRRYANTVSPIFRSLPWNKAEHRQDVLWVLSRSILSPACQSVHSEDGGVCMCTCACVRACMCVYCF
eukprot:XP_017453705.1 PREDICTED: uncharacterized protein LOC103693540 [Rattus norvegicus]